MWKMAIHVVALGAFAISADMLAFFARSCAQRDAVRFLSIYLHPNCSAKDRQDSRRPDPTRPGKEAPTAEVCKSFPRGGEGLSYYLLF